MANNDEAIAGPSWRMTVANATTIEKPIENEVMGQISSTITEVWNELPKLNKKCLVCFTTKNVSEHIPTQKQMVEELRRKIKNFCLHTTKDNCGEALRFCDKSIVPFCGKCFVRVDEIWLLQKQLEAIVQQIDNCVSYVWQIVQRKHSDNYISEKRNPSRAKEEQGVIDLRDMILEAYINNMTMEEELNDVKMKSAAAVPKVEIVDLTDSESENEAEDSITISPTFRVKTEVRNVEQTVGNSLAVQPNDGNSPAIPIVEAVRGADGVVRSVDTGVIGNEYGSENVAANALENGDVEIDVDVRGRIKQEIQEKQKVVTVQVPASNPDPDVVQLVPRKYKFRGVKMFYTTVRNKKAVVCGGPKCSYLVNRKRNYKKTETSHYKSLLEHVQKHPNLYRPAKKRPKPSTSILGAGENTSDFPTGPEQLENTAGNEVQTLVTSEADGAPVVDPLTNTQQQSQIGMQLRSRILPVITFPLTPHEAVNDVIIAALNSYEGESVPNSEGERVPTSEGERVPTSEGESVPNSEEESVPNSEEESVPNSEEESVPNSEKESVPNSEEESVPNSEGESVPNSEGESVPNLEGESVPNSEGESVPNLEGERFPNSEGERFPNSEGESVPNSERESVPNSEGETVLNLEGESVPNSEGDRVPNSEGGSVPNSEGGSVPNSEGGSVPNSEGGSVPNSEGESVASSEEESFPNSEGQSVLNSEKAKVAKTTLNRNVTWEIDSSWLPFLSKLP